MNQQHCKLYSFLKAVRGNWHNAIYLKCCHSICPHRQIPPCEGFLMAADAEGIPILMPIEKFRELTGESVISEECRCTMQLRAFEAAYALYIEWHTSSPYACSVWQLCHNSGNDLSLRQPT